MLDRNQFPFGQSLPNLLKLVHREPAVYQTCITSSLSSLSVIPTKNASVSACAYTELGIPNQQSMSPASKSESSYTRKLRFNSRRFNSPLIRDSCSFSTKTNEPKAKEAVRFHSPGDHLLALFFPCSSHYVLISSLTLTKNFFLVFSLLPHHLYICAKKNRDTNISRRVCIYVRNKVASMFQKALCFNV